MQNKNRPQEGTLLISRPLIGDGFFEQSVVYLTTHDQDGSMGFTLNKQSALIAQDFMNQLPGEDPIFYGGPVEGDALFYLHTLDTLNGAMPAGNGLFLGGDYTVLQDAIKTARELNLDSAKFKFFLGYSGWAAGQLETEIAANTWLSCPGHDDLVFDQDHSGKYDRVLAHMGIHPAMLSNQAGHA